MLTTLELLWEALIAIALAFWVGLLAVEDMILGGKAQSPALWWTSAQVDHGQPDGLLRFWP